MLQKQYSRKIKKSLKNKLEVESEDQMDYDSIDDDQYLDLLKGNEPKSHKSDIQLGEKYKGKKYIQDDESIDSDQIPEYQQNEEEQIDIEEEEEVEEQLPKKQKKQTKTKNKQQMELLQLQEEDLEVIQKSKENIQELQAISTQIKEQIAIWSNLVEIRQQMQKSLELVKKLPINNQEFLKNQSSNSHYNSLTHQILINIGNLKGLYQSLYQNDNDNDVDIFNEGFSQNLIEQLDHIFNQNQQLIQDDIIRWSSKSALFTQMNSKQSMNFLLLTPIGQTQKVMQNKDKLYQKTQLKRGAFRILGEEATDLNEISNKNIYDDTDFYLDLLKESINKNDPEDQTEQYILKRQAQRQEKNEKIVDRKSSKCRKLRLEPHQKLLNFMPKLEQTQVKISRDDIIRNMFGKVQVGQVKKMKFDINLL